MTLRTIATILVLSALVAPAVVAGEMDDIKASMKSRYTTLKKLKSDHKVGENHLGYVSAVTAEAGKDKTVQSIISGENEDRKKLYALIAKNTKTTPDVVGKNNALRIFKKAPKDHYFQTQDGKWRAKADVKAKT
jgi:uncharacterized protein YdbL (DUF1318 family)